MALRPFQNLPSCVCGNPSPHNSHNEAETPQTRFLLQVALGLILGVLAGGGGMGYEDI